MTGFMKGVLYTCPTSMWYTVRVKVSSTLDIDQPQAGCVCLCVPMCASVCVPVCVCLCVVKNPFTNLVTYKHECTQNTPIHIIVTIFLILHDFQNL